MIIANGKIKKKTYCSQCFNTIIWDSSQDEKGAGSHRRVICPNCGWNEDICDDKIDKIEYGIISDPQVYVNGIPHADIEQALNNRQPGDVFVFETDYQYTNTEKQHFYNTIINLNGHKLTFNKFGIQLHEDCVIQNGTIENDGSYETLSAVYCYGLQKKKSNITLNNVNVISSNGKGLSTDGNNIINLNNCNFQTQQECIIFRTDNTTLTINGGQYLANKKSTITGLKEKAYTLIINSGYFSSSGSQTYLPNVLNIQSSNAYCTVNNGTFEVEQGTACVVRGGNLILSEDVEIIYQSSTSKTGKVGDSDILVPGGHQIVLDYKTQGSLINNIKAPNRDIYQLR